MSIENSEMWSVWRKSGIIESNKNLLKMMQNLCDAHKLLNTIDHSYYKLVNDRLMLEWYSLQLIAHARNINEVPNIND